MFLLLIQMYLILLSYPILILSNLLILMTNSTLFMWMVMEINLIAFISLLNSMKNYSDEMKMNYFLIQSTNSFMFMMSNLSMNMSNMNLNLIIIMSLLCKMGMPPFHLWGLKFMIMLNWNLLFLNSSIQKFIPLYILSYFMKQWMMMLMITIIIISPMKTLISSSLKIIFSWSSIIQNIWIMLLLNINFKTWMMYLILYSFMSYGIIKMFKEMNMNYLFEVCQMNKKMFFMFNLNLMAMAGMPPFTGFMTKMLYINNSLYNNSLLMSIMILIMSTFNTFFYLKIILKSSIMNSLNYKNKIYKMNNNNLNIIMMLSTLIMIINEFM